MDVKYYLCPVCEEQRLRYAVIDIDGTNIEEGYCCESCGETFIGLDNSQIDEANPDMEVEDLTVKCKKCGSSDVEIRTWVNPNTSEITSLSYIESLISERDDCWCKDCGENTDLIIEISEKSNDNLLAEIQDWWKINANGKDREVITGLHSDDFASDEEYAIACNECWNNKSSDEIIHIWRKITYID